jgi:hypothetical protein
MAGLSSGVAFFRGRGVEREEARCIAEPPCRADRRPLRKLRKPLVLLGGDRSMTGTPSERDTCVVSLVLMTMLLMLSSSSDEDEPKRAADIRVGEPPCFTLALGCRPFDENVIGSRGRLAWAAKWSARDECSSSMKDEWSMARILAAMPAARAGEQGVAGTKHSAYVRSGEGCEVGGSELLGKQTCVGERAWTHVDGVSVPAEADDCAPRQPAGRRRRGRGDGRL